MAKRSYSQEEVDAILDRAVRAQAKEGTRLTHDELVAAASEVGIPKEAIDSAARDLEDGPEPTDAAIVAAWKKRARVAFLRHFVVYAFVGAMLAFVNLATGGFLWFPIVLFGWGIGIAMHLMSLIFADEERVVARERRKLARRARRERWKRRGAEFERAVDQGVRALLDMIDARDAKRVAPGDPRVRVGEPLEPEEEELGGEDEAARKRRV